MSDEKKQCVTCGKNLREGSPFPTCGKHRTQDEQREQWRLAEERKRRKNGAAPRAPKADSDDRVLAGIGMKPPSPPAEPDWQKQFFALAEALGLDPMQMLTDFCRGWVEDTRRKALGARLDISKSETPAGE